MRFPFSRFLSSLAVCLALLLPGGLAAQQGGGSFSAAITVNDSVITGYELAQRARFLTLLRAPGDVNALAREQLIDDRLKLQAARQTGIELSDEMIRDGMSEFAGRANLKLEEFLPALKASGVDEQTFRDFVKAGLAWREVVRARFAARARAGEAEIDRALGRGNSSALRVLISEIIMPAPPKQAAAVRERADRIARLRSVEAFSAQARRYSATPSRRRGGKLEWQPLSALPAPLQPLILALSPGEVTDPIPLPNAIALFQLRAIEEGTYQPPEIAAVEYAIYTLPGGRSAETLAKARKITGRLDRCDDLYGIAKGQPESRLQRVSKAPGELPTEIAYELSKLDPGEVSTALTTDGGNALMLLMLCNRTPKMAEDANREEIGISLSNRRLASYAESYLQRLRADARIVEK